MCRITSKRGFLVAAMAALMALPPQGLKAAAEAAAEAADQTFDFFLQEAQVTTASRRAQKKSDSPVAIDVISREEIEKSGAHNLWDLLRFRAGIDVMEGSSIEGNSVALNVRGLVDEFAQSLQVMVDGRSIVLPTNQGVFWPAVPVALDDIERVEIVRGPNSALFGSNAGQGVINIITRKAGDGVRVQARGEGGGFGSQAGYAAVELPTLAGNLRVSGQSAQRTQSWTGIYGETLQSGNEVTLNEKTNLRLSSKPWEGGEFELLGGALHYKGRVPSVFGVSVVEYINDYEMVKLMHHLGDSSSVEFSASRSDFNRPASFSTGVREIQYDGELLGRVGLWEDRSQSVLGVSFRHATADSPSLFNAGVLGDEAKRQNRVKRAFLSESLQLLEWATLSAAYSFENSDVGGDQNAYQGALVVKPVENWGLRLSASKAPTLPSMLSRYGHLALPVANVPAFGPPFFNSSPTVFIIEIESSPVKPAQVSSYEATLSGSLLDRHLTLEITPFVMEAVGYTEFNTVASKAPVFGPPTNVVYAQNLQYQSNYYINMKGVETALTFKPSAETRVQLNHTYEDVYFVDRQGGSKRYDRTTPWNKVNLSLYSEIIAGINGGLNLGWVGSHNSYLASRGTAPNGGRIWVEDQAKLDLRLGYSLSKDTEAYVLGQNLLHAYRTESPDGTAVPQVYYAGLNLAWGGK